jgi:glutaminyl-peptide cyclotransferase
MLSPMTAPRSTAALAGAALVCLAGGACAKSPPRTAPPREPEDLVAKVIRAVPHDPAAFTQGLLFFEGRLYESTGLPGRSSLRRVEPESGRVENQIALPGPLFGEGLARVGGQLFQITWQDGKAFVWELSDFKKIREHSYTGEGWGLCYDGHRLVMTDGSDRLFFRDPETFALSGELHVARAGMPVTKLNELECVGGLIYANVWQDDHIARIDAKSGEVTGWIDASGLLSREERMGTDVLNGIAYLPERGTFLITGKLWPRAFEVKFVPRAQAAAQESHP